MSSVSWAVLHPDTKTSTMHLTLLPLSSKNFQICRPISYFGYKEEGTYIVVCIIALGTLYIQMGVVRRSSGEKNGVMSPNLDTRHREGCLSERLRQRALT